MTDAALSRQMFQEILSLIVRLRAPPGRLQQQRCVSIRQSEGFGASVPSTASFDGLLLAANAISRCPSRSKARSWPRNGREAGECRLALNPVSISTRRKLASILLSVAIFATLAGLASRANGRPGIFAILDAIFVGTAVGFFEEFYVQSLRGRWIRNIHPLSAILIYTVIVVVFFLIAIHLSHLLLWPFYELSVPYRRLPFVIPVVIAFSVVGIVVMRTVHFIGIETLFHLTIGTYHRPVIQEKVLVFLDINDSTRLAEELGPVRTKSLVGKFLFDISKPITDHGGEIYLYKGDGVIALWDWHEAIRDNRILRVIDAIFATIGREQAGFLEQFGVVPSFRIGIHGGEVVVSEQGDTKRAIGVYGSTINIAARMEEAAKVHNVSCVVSGDVAEALCERNGRRLPIGHEKVRGIYAEISIFEYRAGEAAARGQPPL